MHPPPLPMGPSRRTAGFTLIELMVVVTIISILVLAVRSSFRKYLANKHTVAAAAEMVRVARQARAESMGLGRAHLVYFEPGFGTRQYGAATLLRGNAMHCEHEDWSAPYRVCVATEGDASSSACVAHIDLAMSDWHYAPWAIVLRTVPPGQERQAHTFATLSPGDATPRALCYDAFGRVFWSNSNINAGAMTFNSVTTNAFGGAFTFVIGLFRDDGSSFGPELPPMVLSFPLGGNPRRLR